MVVVVVANMLAGIHCFYMEREVSCQRITLLKVSSTKYGLRSFRYFAAKSWNALPDSIRAMAGKREFLRSIRYVTF